MNIKKSLHHIECAALGLSTVGTIAAVVTQQLAYMAAPLTLSLSLSLFARHKASRNTDLHLANLEQQFSSQIESLVKQSQALQSQLHSLPPTVSRRKFDKLVDSISTDRQELQRLNQAFSALEQRNNDLVPYLTEIDLTKDSLKQLSLNFSNFEQQLDRQQGTVNGSSNALKTIALDRDARLESLSLSFSDSGSDPIYLSIAKIESKIQLLEDSSKVAEDSIKQVGWRFLELEQAFSTRQDPIAIVELDRSILEISSAIDLDNSHFNDLLERVGDLDASLGGLHDYNLHLTNRLDRYTEDEILAVIDRVVADRFETFKQILPKNYTYELICGRKQSRTIFLQALKQSQKRLVLVCPWLTEFAVNKDVRNLLRAALERGVSIEIGWGHLKDANNDRSQLSKEKLFASSDWAYNAVPGLYELQVEYPNLLKLKILGTHEKFLICDRQFAMLGSHNYLTSDTKSSEREVGIKTDSTEIIDKLIEIFDRAEA
ncbi:phospholipase D-like domain-containing protein [Chamaesiphon sp. VAR_69_metabat_338]|uniref:phospholipase D-like domain-containing protein n=1 Tax=Chamaesiphon sp. VAR_69_metabat_338 TaxID=2964704 RepID=UPI00286DBE40|nr:phospholipase D-like domain-containing protein [Chamaesiphon sp. VAR_69_metabat_338]